MFDAINALEGELEKLSDEALRARTADFKKQVAEGASLDDILVRGIRDRARGRQAHAWGNGTSTYS